VIVGLEFIREKNIDTLKLKDSGYDECGSLRFDGVYYQYENPSWKRHVN